MKRHGHWVPFLLVLSLALSGCASLTPYRSSGFRHDSDADKVYAAAVRTFVRRGWGFQGRDPVARALETDWFQIDGYFGPAGYYVQLSHRILIDREVIDIFTSCVIGADTTGWEPCPDDQRPPGTRNREVSLIQDILEETKRL